MTEDVKKKKGQRPEDRGETPYKGGRNVSKTPSKESEVKPPWTRGVNRDDEFLVK